MKLIIDENLPRQLVSWLSGHGCEATHIIDLGLRGATDNQVWSAAVERDAALLTRDSDFLDVARRSAAGGVIRLTIGNCTTATLFAWLETVWPAVVSRWDAGERIIEAP